MRTVNPNFFFTRISPANRYSNGSEHNRTDDVGSSPHSEQSLNQASVTVFLRQQYRTLHVVNNV